MYVISKDLFLCIQFALVIFAITDYLFLCCIYSIKNTALKSKEDWQDDETKVSETPQVVFTNKGNNVTPSVHDKFHKEKQSQVYQSDDGIFYSINLHKNASVAFKFNGQSKFCKLQVVILQEPVFF